MVACVIGGVLGGLTLTRPVGARGLAGFASLDLEAGAVPSPDALTQGRAFGGLLIVSHAGAALFLGYQPSVGTAMAFALAMAWFGAALGRAVSALVDRVRTRVNFGSLAFEVMIAVTLSLPFFNPGRLVIMGGKLV
ncbi:MAG: DUF4345 family protein [Gemmatimonadaceae bacterium]|nr:DUF4345 family protein [Caulobacter sp.]